MRTEAQKNADKKYNKKRLIYMTTLQMPKDLKEKIKDLAQKNFCTQIEVLYKLINKENK